MARVSFGEWLRVRRRAGGWTQKELALQLHCSISALRKMESEDRRPSVQFIERLADFFKIPEIERKPFLQFARGDWQAVSDEEGSNTPWQIPHSGLRANLPALRTTFIGHEEVDGLLRLAGESTNVSEKLTLLHQAHQLAESLGDVHRQTDSLWQLGWSDNANRFGYWERAIELARPFGDVQELAKKLSTMGFFFVLNGDIKTAQKYLNESSALYQQLNMKPAAVHLLSAQGQIALLSGDFEKARMYLQEHARIALEYGSHLDYLWSQVRLGYVALRANNLDDARHMFMESAQNFKKKKLIIGVVFTLEGMAGIYVTEDRPGHATRLIGWANVTRERIHDTRPLLEQADVDKIITACLARLGEETFSDAYDEGQKMTLEEALAYAFQED